MSNNKTMFGRNEIIFTMFRYLTYGLQAARGFILAYFLGPYFLGIYGYLMLYQQYLSYTNLGINYSVNSELALLGDKEPIERSEIINSAFSGACFISLSLLIIATLVYFFKIRLFPFEGSYNYSFVLVGLTILTHFQQIFVNIFRLDKKLKPIIWGELILSLGLFIVVIFFRGINLINMVFYMWTLLLFIIVVIYRVIYREKIIFKTNRIRLLLSSGFPLLIYVFSYYLMNLMVRTLIGAFYPVSVMGYFSFANNVTTAIMLGLDTITWIIFPSMISKLADDKLLKEDLVNYLVSFTNKLLVVVLIIVSLSIAGLPLLFYFLPKYTPIKYSLIILLVNQIVFNSGFVFISLAMAKKMHKKMALISLLSAGIAGIFALAFCYYKLSFTWLVISNMIGSLCFINILIWYISKKFDLCHSKLMQSFSLPLQLLLTLIVVAAALEFFWIAMLLLVIVFALKFNSIKELYLQLSTVLKRKIV